MMTPTKAGGSPADAVASIVSSEQLMPEKILERTPQP